MVFIRAGTMPLVGDVPEPCGGQQRPKVRLARSRWRCLETML